MLTKEVVDKYFKGKLETSPQNNASKILKDLELALTSPGLIEIAEDDIEKITSSSNKMIALSEEAHGKERAQELGRKIVASIGDIFQDKKASNVLFNITGSPDLTLYEVKEVAEYIYNAAAPDANIIFGAVIDEEKKDYINATVIFGSA